MIIINTVTNHNKSKFVYVPLALLLDKRLSLGARWMWARLASLTPGSCTADVLDACLTGRGNTRREYAHELDRCGWLAVSPAGHRLCDGSVYELQIPAERAAATPGKACCAVSIIANGSLSFGAILTYFVMRSRAVSMRHGVMMRVQAMLGTSKVAMRGYFFELAAAGMVKREGGKFNPEWSLRFPGQFTKGQNLKKH